LNICIQVPWQRLVERRRMMLRDYDKPLKFHGGVQILSHI
jgi:hypothetical protein